jgi:radical SAM superfamily enzyme YgiQ (UPF0313 family)
MKLLFANTLSVDDASKDELVEKDRAAAYTSAVREHLLSKGVAIKKPANPFGVNLSIGLLSIAAFIREHLGDAHQMTYYLANERDHEGLERELARHDVALVTSYSHNYHWALEILRRAKERGLITVYGGPHATALHEELIKLGYVDIIARGEGEVTAKELVEVEFQPRETIAGITYMKDGEVVVTADRKPIPFDDIPQPAYDLLDPAQRETANIFVETARGCPNRCIYCVETNLFRGVRNRSTDLVRENINKVRELFIYDEYAIVDPTFNTSTRRVEEMIPLLDEFDSYWIVNIALKNLTDRQIELLRQSKRITTAYIGLESGSDRVLQINKGEKVTYQGTYVEKLRKIRFFPYIWTGWVFGLPGETHESLRESVQRCGELLKEGLIDLAFPNSYVPYPLTLPYMDPDKYNLVVNYDNLDKGYHRGGDVLPSVPRGMTQEDIINAKNDLLAMNQAYGNVRPDFDVVA